MYVVSFRIPFIGPLGNGIYHNGAAPSKSKKYQKGDTIMVAEGTKEPWFAEVIDTRPTQRQANSFRWVIYEEKT